MSRWGQLSAPVFAGDNTRRCHEQSAAAMNNRKVAPTGRPMFPQGRVTRNPSKCGAVSHSIRSK